MAKKRRSYKELAAEYQLTTYIISTLKQSGVNVYDRDSVRVAVMKKVKMPKGWENGCPWDDQPSDDEGDDPHVGDLLEQLENSSDYHTTRAIKMKIAAMRDYVNYQKEKGELIERHVVVDDMQRISSGVRSGMMRLKNDLPSIIEGLTAAQMKGKIDIKVNEILRLLADETSELYPVSEITE